MNRQDYLEAIGKRINDHNAVAFDLEDGLVDIECKDGTNVSIPIDVDSLIKREQAAELLRQRYPDGVPSQISDFWGCG